MTNKAKDKLILEYYALLGKLALVREMHYEQRTDEHKIRYADCVAKQVETHALNAANIIQRG